MQVTSTSFNDMQRIPAAYAFCAPDPKTHATLSKNLNPQLAWSGAPAGTKSFAIVCHDPDVPSKGDDVNKEGRSVPVSLPRVDFFHWVLVDVPASMTAIQEGAFASGVVARGKPGPVGPNGTRQGLNNYTNWFAGDKDMGGDYYGYDGPCPPWNDERLHHYVFTVCALDVEKLSLPASFGGPEVLKAMEGHVLASAKITGTYTLNPALGA
jgi:Raf kinase inhibitor-like YbhB/YbcL family protein